MTYDQNMPQKNEKQGELGKDNKKEVTSNTEGNGLVSESYQMIFCILRETITRQVIFPSLKISSGRTLTSQETFQGYPKRKMKIKLLRAATRPMPTV